MFGLETLNVLIGLVTVYLAFGVACTAIVETILAWRKIRSKNLEKALREFLAGDPQAERGLHQGILRPPARAGA